MLKTVLPVLICICFFSASHAQVNSAVAFYKAGMEHKKNNRFSEALGAFSQATSLNKRFDSAFYEMGNIYSGSGNADMAIINYRKTLVINPRFANALINTGKVYRDIKLNLDSAMYFYQAAVTIDTTNKELFYSLAWTHNARKEYEQAIPYAIKALELDNKYKPAYGELGHAYRATKKYAEAIEQFKKNLAISVMDVALLYSGYCYTELNNKEGALQMYEELKKVNEKMSGALKKKIDTMQ